ncbi:MAG: hypothetical protein AAFY43_01670 [Pseudomonadota bacterium]
MSHDKINRHGSAEARYYGNDLDEVVAHDVAFFHLEQMDGGHWWISLTMADGTTTHIDIMSKSGRGELLAAALFDG